MVFRLIRRDSRIAAETLPPVHFKTQCVQFQSPVGAPLLSLFHNKRENHFFCAVPQAMIISAETLAVRAITRSVEIQACVTRALVNALDASTATHVHTKVAAIVKVAVTIISRPSAKVGLAPIWERRTSQRLATVQLLSIQPPLQDAILPPFRLVSTTGETT